MTKNNDTLLVEGSNDNGSHLVEKPMAKTMVDIDKEEATEEEKTVRRMFQRLGKLHCDSSVQYGRNFAVRESDVFVATFPKCGTTWMSAICHALRTRGQDEFQLFGEITEVVPYDIVARCCGQDLEADQVAEPRLFKSHEQWVDIAKGGRYIYVCRNPEDTLISSFHFLPALNHCNNGTITIEGYARAMLHGERFGPGWVHFVEWIQAALDMPDKILVITYEDLKQDLKHEIRRIAKFLQVSNVDDALVDRVHKLTTFEYMKSHESQFDDHFIFDKLKHRMGLQDEKSVTTKVNTGSTRRGKVELPPAIRSLLRDKWANYCRPRLGGVESYEEAVETIIRGNIHQHHSV